MTSPSIIAHPPNAGDFVMGEMHGQGVMEFSNGDCYEGTFVHNVMEGEMPMTCESLAEDRGT
jgi:hypothetical protein